MINYRLIHSQRKTIAIIINNRGVEVRAPLRASKADIDRFVLSKQKWIEKHLTIIEQNIVAKAAFSISYGDKALMCGNEYPITAKEGKNAGFDGVCFYLPPDLTSNEIKQTMINIYKLVAKDLITKRVLAYAKQMHLMPSAVKITGAKTRWGSCSSRNSINFSWQLIMADDYVIDYVVVHELAHIKEHNHSGRFWSVVSDVMPDYEKREEKLKELHERLSKEDWE